MKRSIPFSLLAAFAAAGFAAAQAVYTNPVGYVTQTVTGGGIFNLVGVTMHEPIVSRAQLAATPTDNVLSVPDGVADALGAGPYIIEFTSGSLDGAQNLILSFNASTDTITIENDLSFGLLTGDQFSIRKVATLGKVFGNGDGVVINKGDATTGDLVYVPVGGGLFDIYHHTTDSFFGPGSWTRIGGGGNGSNTPIAYSDSVFVKNLGSTFEFTMSGEVKMTKSITAVADTFNYLSTVYPVGLTLNGSGIANSPGFLKGDATTGDIVLSPNPNSPGTFISYHHTADSFFGPGEWIQVGGGSSGNAVLSSGIIIQRRAAAPYNVTIIPPASYQN